MSTDDAKLLIEKLHQAGFEALDRETVDAILALGTVGVPLLQEVLDDAEDPVQARALALLGEMGEPAVLHDVLPFFAEDSDGEDAVTDSAEWAFHRIAVRHPAGTLEAIRELTAEADPIELSSLSKHLSMMPDVPGRTDTLRAFANRLPDFDREGRALVVSGMIIAAMFLDGPRGELPATIRTQYGADLNRDSLKMLKEVEDELIKQPYDPAEEEGSSIYDLVCEGFELHEEGTHVRAEPKLGRNDPCWCGSGKKYKKCHLEADEGRK